jgi:hypothetical protein
MNYILYAPSTRAPCTAGRCQEMGDRRQQINFAQINTTSTLAVSLRRNKKIAKVLIQCSIHIRVAFDRKNYKWHALHITSELKLQPEVKTIYRVNKNTKSQC